MLWQSLPDSSATALSGALASSAVTDAFRSDVEAFLRRSAAPRVRTRRLLPQVKTARVLTQLLSTRPELAIAAVEIDAVSGCSDLRGTVTVDTPNETLHIAFVWDCRWRARIEGWNDAFGHPDQARAAREFDWRCFSQWRG